MVEIYNTIEYIINTSENLEAAIKHLKETSTHTKISISSLVTRKDKVTFDIKVNDTNEKLEQLCKKRKVDLICNNNIDQSCLSSKQLFSNQFYKIYKFCLIDRCNAQC